MAQRKTKYVTGEMRSGDFNSTLVAVVFPESIAHTHIAQSFLSGEVRSAGFFYVDDNKVIPYGESQGLGLRPVEGDENLIARAIGLHPDCGRF